MGWFDDQIKLRKQNDEIAFDSAFRKIAGAVTGGGCFASSMDDSEKAQSAIGDILSYYHVKKADIPKKIVTVEEKLDFALHPS